MSPLVLQALALGSGRELPSGEEGEVGQEPGEDRLSQHPCSNLVASSVGRLAGSPLPYKLWGQGSR